MANPPKFTPAYSYSGWQASNPAKPLPAPRIDNDFASIQASLNAAIDGLADVRRSDGVLANQSVGPDQLSAALSIGFTFRGAWDDGGSYSAGDGVVHDGVFYSARVTHTASGDNDPPNAAVWNELFSVADIAVAGALTMPRDGFTGDGSTKTFALTFVPLSSRNLFVTIGGVPQSISEYTVNGSDIIFAEAPPAGYEIEVRAFATTATTTVPEDGTVTSAKLADASVTEPKLADGAVSTAKLVDEAVTEAKLAVTLLARIPGVVADTFLIGNAAGTAISAETFTQTRKLLGDFDNEADFEAASISATLANVVTRGYYVAGDGGGHRKVRIATPSPAKAWHKQSADGAWWEIAEPEYDARYFGVSAARTATENSTLLQDAIDAASVNKRKLNIRGGPIDCAGGLYARAKLKIEWAPDAWLRQTEYSPTGAFFTNVSPVQAERAVSDIVLINPLIDLSALTYDVSDTTHSENGIGFARGAERITIWGGHIKGVLPNFNSAGGWGGKAIGLDGGVKSFTAIGVRMESTFYGAWVRGNEGAFSNGLDGLEQTQSNKFIGCHFEDVSLPIAIMGRDANEDPDYHAQDISVQFIGNTWHNGGFAPNVPASNTDRYKGGIINLGEAQCFLIDGLTGWNDDDYVTQKGGWPATGDVIGQGLSGAPCHIVNGWGGAGTIRNIHAQGPVDYHWKCERAFAMGDDAASSDPSETRRVKVNYLLIDNIRHIGGCIGIFSQSDYYPVTTSSDIRARMDNIFPYALSGGIVAANSATLESMTIKVFQSSTKWIEGTPKFLHGTVGNALSASDSQSWSENHRNSKPQSYPIKTVANGATISFPLSKMEGLLAFSYNSALGQGIIKYRAVTGSTAAALYGVASISNVAVTTGASPAGSASTVTFSIDDAGNMWVNNQRGASLDITFNQLV